MIMNFELTHLAECSYPDPDWMTLRAETFLKKGIKSTRSLVEIHNNLLNALSFLELVKPGPDLANLLQTFLAIKTFLVTKTFYFVGKKLYTCKKDFFDFSIFFLSRALPFKAKSSPFFFLIFW